MIKWRSLKKGKKKWNWKHTAEGKRAGVERKNKARKKAE